MEHLVKIAAFPETTDHWEGVCPLRDREQINAAAY